MCAHKHWNRYTDICYLWFSRSVSRFGCASCLRQLLAPVERKLFEVKFFENLFFFKYSMIILIRWLVLGPTLGLGPKNMFSRKIIGLESRNSALNCRQTRESRIACEIYQGFVLSSKRKNKATLFWFALCQLGIDWPLYVRGRNPLTCPITYS